MVPNFIDAVSLLWVGIKDASDDVLALSRQELRQGVFGSHDLLVEVRSLWVFERQVTADHRVKDNATAPNISFETVVSFACNHFWRCVARRTAGCLESCSHLVHITQSEIHYLQSQIVVKQQVFWLEVSVTHAALVDVLDARDELEVELAGLLLRQPSVPDDVVEQLTAAAVLHDHVELLFSFNNLVELNDVGVTHLLENLDFPGDSLDVLLIVDLVFLEDLNGDLLAC